MYWVRSEPYMHTTSLAGPIIVEGYKAIYCNSKIVSARVALKTDSDLNIHGNIFRNKNIEHLPKTSISPTFQEAPSLVVPTFISDTFIYQPAFDKCKAKKRRDPTMLDLSTLNPQDQYGEPRYYMHLKVSNGSYDVLPLFEKIQENMFSDTNGFLGTYKRLGDNTYIWGKQIVMIKSLIRFNDNDLDIGKMTNVIVSFPKERGTKARIEYDLTEYFFPKPKVETKVTTLKKALSPKNILNQINMFKRQFI